MDSIFSPDKRKFSPKVIRWLRRVAKNKCEVCGNSNCLELGHINSAKHGGKPIKSNAVLLCFDCNKKQRDNPLWTYLKKNNIEPKSPRIATKLKRREMRELLKRLHLWQLESLAKQKHKKLKGRHTITKFATLLAPYVSKEEINAVSRQKPPEKKKRRRRRSTWFL